MDPASAMRLARRLAAASLGVDELPPEADVECSLDKEGNFRVRGSVVAQGYAPAMTMRVKLRCIYCGWTDGHPPDCRAVDPNPEDR